MNILGILMYIFVFNVPFVYSLAHLTDEDLRHEKVRKDLLNDTEVTRLEDDLPLGPPLSSHSATLSSSSEMESFVF